MIEASLGRLGAIKGRLLPGQLFREMAGAATLKDALRLLTNTTYNNAVEHFTGSSTIELEHLLRKDALSPWSKVIKFLEGTPRACASLMVGPLELENIRIAVRALSYGQVVPHEQISDIGHSANIDSSNFLSMRELPQIEEFLKNTPYEGIYTRAIARLVSREAPFGFEQALSTGLRSEQINLTKAVGGSEGRGAAEYLEQRILMTNARWAIWLRLVRNMKSDEVANHMVNLPTKNSKKKTAMFVKCNSSKEASELLETQFEIQTKSSSPGELARAIRAAQDAYSRKQLRTRFMTFASILAFYDVMDTECRNIVTILTGLRQGRSAEFITGRIAVA